MGSSLDKLVENLKTKGLEHFKFTREEFGEEDLDILTKKGIFPYDLYTSEEVLDKSRELPPKKAFYNSLKNEEVKEADYLRAKLLWRKWGCKTLRDYMEMYLKLDCTLLADVFQNFRGIYYGEYKLDPVYYLTFPSLSLDAALKTSGVKLDILNDQTMYNFLEAGIRGGITYISKRYAKANNPYMGRAFNPCKEVSYISYLDANNLYGYVMREDLPVSNFRWEAHIPKSWRLERYLKEVKDCILEVDIECPPKIHDKVKDFPLFPEKLNGKLMTTLHPKKRYITHSSTVAMGLKLGYKIAKVHNILRYESNPWLRGYIDKNTELRSRATSTFEKDLYKLANNSVFGKQMENVRNRTDVRLVSTEKKFQKLLHKHNFKNMVELEKDKELTLVEMAMREVKLDKPIYGGLVILDRSKVHIQDFYYNYLQPKYGSNYQLLMTDTDSLMGIVKTRDIYRDMNPDVDEWFDTSNLPEELPISTGVNKRVPGKFKDETNGVPIHEFVGVAPKQYAYRVGDEVTKKCKGVTKGALTKITFDDYKAALNPNTKPKEVDMKIIRSRNHTLYTETISKTVFNPKGAITNRAKRKVRPNGINTLPWGYKR